MLALAAEVGLDADAVKHGVACEAVKRRLVNATDGAIAAGAVGVPSVVASGQCFWGDDQLEEAAAAVASIPR